MLVTEEDACSVVAKLTIRSRTKTEQRLSLVETILYK